jgi:hypothetical protein
MNVQTLTRKRFAELVADISAAREFIDTYQDKKGHFNSYEGMMCLLHYAREYPQKYTRGFNLTNEQYIEFYKLLEEHGCSPGWISERIHYLSPTELESGLIDGDTYCMPMTVLERSEQIVSEKDPNAEMHKRIILKCHGNDSIRHRVNRLSCYETVKDDWYEEEEDEELRNYACVPELCTHPLGFDLLCYSNFYF